MNPHKKSEHEAAVFDQNMRLERDESSGGRSFPFSIHFMLEVTSVKL